MYQPLLTRKGSQESKNWKKMFRMNTRVLLEMLSLLITTLNCYNLARFGIRHQQD